MRFNQNLGLFGLLLMTAVIFSSCRSNKDLSYLRDTWPSKTLPGMPLTHAPYKIKIQDNLFVSVLSDNAEMNEIYNPSTVGTGRAINNIWQTQSGQFLYGYMVDPDGSVMLPSLGKVPVLGLTLNECEAKIKTVAEEYLKNVTVKVRLLNFKVTVMGEVQSPGVYYNYNPEYTIFDALSAAGGATPAAKLNQVLVVRRIENGSKTITLNLNSQTALASEGFILEPNDVVVVAPGKFRSQQLGLPFYSAMLSTLTTFVLILNFISNQ